MQKVILIVGLFVLVNLSFFSVSTASAQKGRGQVTTISGNIGVEIREATGVTPEVHRYFLRQSDGMSYRDITITAAHGKINFAELLHRDVELTGIALNRSKNLHDKQQSLLKMDGFEVIEISKVFPSPQDEVDHYTSDLLTLPPPTMGQHSVIVILVYFPQLHPTQPFTSEWYKNLMFTGEKSVKNWVLASSFRQFDVVALNDPTGDVTPWMPLTTVSPTDCADNIGESWREAADSMATQQGYNPALYDSRVYIYPNIPGCTVSYMATIGRYGGTQTYPTNIYMHLPSNITDSVIVQAGFHRSLMHELIHNLGQNTHDNAEEFEGGPIWNYGDRISLFGASTTPLFPNNIMRIKFGWLTTAQCVTLTTRGTHTIFLQTPAIATKGIGPSSPPVCTLIPGRNLAGELTGFVYVLERRRQFGLWEQFNTDVQDFTRGIIIRRHDVVFNNSWNGSVMVNANPSDPSTKTAAVDPGQVFTIQGTNFTVEAGWPTVYSQMVRVTLGNNYPE